VPQSAGSARGKSCYHGLSPYSSTSANRLTPITKPHFVRRPHADGSLRAPIPGQPQAALRTAIALAAQIPMCQAVGANAWQSRHPPRPHRRKLRRPTRASDRPFAARRVAFQRAKHALCAGAARERGARRTARPTFQRSSLVKLIVCRIRGKIAVSTRTAGRRICRFCRKSPSTNVHEKFAGPLQPHDGLGGKTPTEVYEKRFAANRKPRHEPRARWQKSVPCARPWALTRGSPGAKLELAVEFHHGRRHLPIVSLRSVAYRRSACVRTTTAPEVRAARAPKPDFSTNESDQPRRRGIHSRNSHMPRNSNSSNLPILMAKAVDFRPRKIRWAFTPLH
jgi:hypothetical protein